MENRIKAIRKGAKLTQSEFGEKIGTRGNTITNYETGLRNPSNAVITAICREFNVNEQWLREGTGPMYVETAESYINEMCARHGLGASARALLQAVANAFEVLDEDTAAALVDRAFESLAASKRDAQIDATADAELRPADQQDAQ